jgi:hypothetical protein
MAEFVQQHAQEQEHNEKETAPRDLRPAREVVHAENPGEEQQERDMDANGRAGNRSDVQRPGHDILFVAVWISYLNPEHEIWRAAFRSPKI